MKEKRYFREKRQKTNDQNLDNEKTVVWIYNLSKTGEFWFVDIEGQEKWYFVHEKNVWKALSWDEVLASVNVFKGREEAKILKVLKRENHFFVWEFIPAKSRNKTDNERWFTYGFVSVDDNSIKTDIFIPGKYIGEAKAKDIVWVEIVSWDDKKPEWKIVQILWKDKNKIRLESLILKAWFKQDFVWNIKVNRDLNISKNRHDLRKIFTFTIDWEDAKDLDDAISIVKKENWDFVLYVHIADVSHFIKEYSELDKQAFSRATSVYLTHKVIPMLPEELSNDLCSLNPNTPKFTLTCEMLFSPDWTIKKTQIYESLIESNFRLTYKEVDEILDSKINIDDKLMFDSVVDNELVETLKNAEELRCIIEKNKEITWVLNFDFPETKVILEPNSQWEEIKMIVKEIVQYPRYKSNKLIEEFMISANQSVAKYAEKLPFLHRIHPKPSSEDIEKLQKILDLFEVKFKLKTFSTKEFSILLDHISTHPKKTILESIILRTLTKAIYSPKNEWHFWLWLEFYSHFTSPIRRYPDLQIHRILKYYINGDLDNKKKNHFKEILENVANHCSSQERKAEKLEYKVRDYFISTFYKDKVWQYFEATISWVISKWIFMSLVDSAEWFIEIKQENFNFREDLFLFIDNKTGKKYSLWDSLKVKLLEVDEVLFRLNFWFAD